MSDFTDSITDEHCAIIGRQPVFFTATAAADGRINLSPKGYDAFRVLSPTRVAWLDLGGSGNETQAHLTADGRITIMFCEFDRPAIILRLYGTGRSVLGGDEDWSELSAHFTLLPGTRQIFDVMVDSVQTSCGWGVPQMTLERERPTLLKWAANDPEGWELEMAERTTSIDGLPVRPPARYVGPPS